ncbi:MAG: TolC family protein [Bacteroidales bacterium]|nr:TolC family protein [Bacteroidales bacterium]
MSTPHHFSAFSRKRILFGFFLFIAGSCLLQAQEKKVWSLEDCIAYAMENNIQVKKQGLAVNLAEQNLLESRASMLPSLNGNASHGYNWGRTIDRFTNTFATERVQFNNFYLSSGVYVFNGFRMLNTVRKSQLDLGAARYDVDKMRDDIALSIAMAYLNILFSEEQLTNIRGQAGITRQQTERTRKLVDAGSLAKGALLTLEAQYAQEEKQVVDAENLVAMNYLTLTQMLDLQDVGEFRILKPAMDLEGSLLPSESAEAIYTYALEHQPAVKAAELRLESADRDLMIARGLQSPSLAVQGSWGTGYSGASQQLKDFTINGIDTVGYTIEPTPIPVGVPSLSYNYEKIPFRDQIDQNNNTTLGLYLTIPIFNGFQARTAMGKARLGIMNAEYDLQLQRNQLYKDIQQSHADAVASFRRWKAANTSRNALNESFGYSEQRFNVGMVTSVEYNDAKNKLAQAESEVLQAKYEHIFRKTILDYYLGKPNTLK